MSWTRAETRRKTRDRARTAAEMNERQKRRRKRDRRSRGVRDASVRAFRTPERAAETAERPEWAVKARTTGGFGGRLLRWLGL